MKFWQLLDVFRDEKSLLVEVFSKDKWRNYLNYYYDIEAITINQDRDILDAQVDQDLLKEICTNSKKLIYLSSKKKVIYSYKSGFTESVIPIAKAITMFNHDSIEEVFEKTESNVSYL